MTERSPDAVQCDASEEPGAPGHPLGKDDVTVVVPTRNSATTLRICLESIKAQQHPCTLVVVDNGSTDDTPRIANELADIVLDIGPERSAQRNAGAAATKASVVGFIDSDMELTPNVVGEAIVAILDGAASVVVPERTIGEGFWTEVRAYERTFYQGSDAIEAPRFFPRAVFDRAGGFDETLTGPEDWDLGMRTVADGPRVRITPVILHHEGHVRYLEACQKKAYYAPGVARFLSKHGASGMAVVSARPWLKQPRLLVTPLGLGMLALKVGEVCAVLLAMAADRLGKELRLPDSARSATAGRGR